MRSKYNNKVYAMKLLSKLEMVSDGGHMTRACVRLSVGVRVSVLSNKLF